MHLPMFCSPLWKPSGYAAQERAEGFSVFVKVIPWKPRLQTLEHHQYWRTPSEPQREQMRARYSKRVLMKTPAAVSLAVAQLWEATLRRQGAEIELGVELAQ